METKKSLQHRVFVFGHPVNYEPLLTELNVVDRARRNAVVAVQWFKVEDNFDISKISWKATKKTRKNQSGCKPVKLEKEIMKGCNEALLIHTLLKK